MARRTPGNAFVVVCLNTVRPFVVTPIEIQINCMGQTLINIGALGRTRTANPLIRSQMLYPLSYERLCTTY